MGFFTKIGKWIDKGIERILGKPAGVPSLPTIVRTPKPIISARKALLEERHFLFEEDMPMWERNMRKAINEHKEEGMEEEEIADRYGDEWI